MNIKNVKVKEIKVSSGNIVKKYTAEHEDKIAVHFTNGKEHRHLTEKEFIKLAKKIFKESGENKNYTTELPEKYK